MGGVSEVAGLLLAAGAGRRMGGPKGLVRDGSGEAWVARSARVLAAGGCSPVVVVVGAAAGEVRALVPEGCPVVVAADWAEGMGASLRAGLSAVPAAAGPEAVAVVVGLVDTPGVTAEAVRLLVDRARAAGPAGLSRAVYAGVPGHPVVLGREHWAGAAASARGDAGARGYLAGRHVVGVECGAVGDGRDVDEPGADVRGYAGGVSTDTSRPDTSRPDTSRPDTSRPDPEAAHPALTPEHLHTQRAHDTSRIGPPARRVVLTAVTDEALDVVAHEAAVAGPASGAVVTFSGAVRDHDGGRPVAGIEYVGHPRAAAVLAEVVAEVTARSDADAVAVSHRIGELGIGDAALVVAVAAAHRQEAFAAAALLVDEIKHRLPVWKRQIFTDGSDEWVACP
jgi:molybdopterin synthase catalytic subunit/CTP:molybdopterin cytidylyltransferase MocA